MDKAERIGLGVATAGHVILFAVLSLGLVSTSRPLPRLSDPVDVQLVDEVGLRPAAPVISQEAPAPSVAPEVGPPEEAAPPEPAPVPPAPEPTPPPPAPKPQPKPTPPAPKPEPKPAPKPKPTPPKPALKPTPAPKPKPAPAKPSPPASAPKAAASKAFPAKAAVAPKASPAKTPPAKSAGAGTRPKASGGAIGEDFLKGITPEKSAGKSQAPRAAVVGQTAMNGLGAAIKRQVQPCYERKGIVGPGAERINTVLRLRLNPDGSLSSRPTVSEQTGVDGSNQRYAKRAAEVAIAAVMECTPLKLPANLYEGGWEDIEPSFAQVGAQ